MHTDPLQMLAAARISDLRAEAQRARLVRLARAARRDETRGRLRPLRLTLGRLLRAAWPVTPRRVPAPRLPLPPPGPSRAGADRSR